MQTTYGERLKRARLNAGLSQSELARRCGLRAQTIQYLEEPENAAQGSKSTARFAQELNVSAVWLAAGEGEMLPAGVREPAARYEIAAPDLARSIRALRPELRRALGVLIDALASEPGARTFALHTKHDAKLQQVGNTRRRRT